MKALDTNILVRFLVRDDPRQADAVYRLFKQAEIERTEFFIPVAVTLELIWVLESAYAISRKDLLDAIDDLLLMSIFLFEHHHALQQFVQNARSNTLDPADLIIAFTAIDQNCEKVLTFDRKALRSHLFEAVL